MMFYILNDDYSLWDKTSNFGGLLRVSVKNLYEDLNGRMLGNARPSLKVFSGQRTAQ